MTEAITTIPLADIILDEGIYPRQKIDHKRVLGAVPPGNCRRHAKEKNPQRDQPLCHHLTTGLPAYAKRKLKLWVKKIR